MVTAGAHVHSAVTTVQGYTLRASASSHASTAALYQAVGLLNVASKSLASVSPNVHAHAAVGATAKVLSAIAAAWPITLTAHTAVHSALSVIQGVLVLSRVAVSSTPLPTAHFYPTLIQLVKSHDALARFLGGSLTASASSHATPSVLRTTQAQVAANALVSSVLGHSLLFSVTLDDALVSSAHVSDHALVKMIFSGALHADARVTIGYVDEKGAFTTWAMNTRTNAVTQYENYDFTSFAQMGDSYIGANAQGLWELDGGRDDLENIIPMLRTGYAQLAQDHLAGIAAAYVAMRGETQIVLKIITPDGREYIYQADTLNMRTTKINLGRGLRSRFFAFELVGSGADMDLESLSFIPMVAQRRVDGRGG